MCSVALLNLQTSHTSAVNASEHGNQDPPQDTLSRCISHQVRAHRWRAKAGCGHLKCRKYSEARGCASLEGPLADGGATPQRGGAGVKKSGSSLCSRITWCWSAKAHAIRGGGTAPPSTFRSRRAHFPFASSARPQRRSMDAARLAGRYPCTQLLYGWSTM